MANNNSLTADLVAQLIANQTRALEHKSTQQNAELRCRLQEYSEQEYTATQINDTIRCDESFDVIKSIPEFSGSYNAYVSWREAANNGQ